MDTRLKNIEFDLLYLGLLTKKEIKPLSRWEREFGIIEIEALKSMGLKIRSIERYLESGRIFEELIFSVNEEFLYLYANTFMRKPINNSFETVLSEGKLFGYPECCVRSFVNRGYLPNRFSMDDQKILFHWACPNCHVTTKLLPQYRSAYQEARRIQVEYSLKKLRKKRIAGMIPLIGLTSCILVIGCEHKSTTPSDQANIHWISVENDLDKDYLKDEWEEHLELDPSNPDTDRDGVLDGVQLAKGLWSQIQNPPEWIKIDDNLMYGLYVCSKCGATVNMGFMEITNTRKNRSIRMDYLALHYMEHGSLAYEGKEGISGLVDAIQLNYILSNSPSDKPDIHCISVENDLDRDYLKDEWEEHLGLDSSSSDTDRDGVLDGVQLAKGLWSKIQNPPEWIKIDDHSFRGLHTCSKCGKAVNMGFMEITNTTKNDSILIHYLALHYMEHGSLAYEGKEGISGIVNATQLDSILSK